MIQFCFRSGLSFVKSPVCDKTFCQRNQRFTENPGRTLPGDFSALLTAFDHLLNSLTDRVPNQRHAGLFLQITHHQGSSQIVILCSQHVQNPDQIAADGMGPAAILIWKIGFLGKLLQSFPVMRAQQVSFGGSDFVKSRFSRAGLIADILNSDLIVTIFTKKMRLTKSPFENLVFGLSAPEIQYSTEVMLCL